MIKFQLGKHYTQNGQVLRCNHVGDEEFPWAGFDPVGQPVLSAGHVHLTPDHPCKEFTWEGLVECNRNGVDVEGIKALREDYFPALKQGKPIKIWNHTESYPYTPLVEDTPLEESHDDWDPAEVIAAKDQQIALLEKERDDYRRGLEQESEDSEDLRRDLQQAQQDCKDLKVDLDEAIHRGRCLKMDKESLEKEVERLKNSNKWLDTNNAGLWKEVTELRLLKGRTGIHPGAETWSKVNGERLIAVREPLDVEVECRKKNLVRCLNRRGEAQWRYRTELTRTKPTSRLRTIGAPILLAILSVILGVCL